MIKILLLIVSLFYFANDEALAQNKSAPIAPYHDVVANLIRTKRAATDVTDGLQKGAEISKSIAETFAAVGDVNKWVDAGTKILKLGTNIAKVLGPALGGIGIAFSIIGAFLPEQPNPELEAIKDQMTEGFKEMHGRFDELSMQITQLSGKVDFLAALEKYEKVQKDLRNVNTDFKHLSVDPTSKPYRTKFVDACSNQVIEPSQALVELHGMIVKPGLPGTPHLLSTITTQAQLDYKIVMAWFVQITTDAFTLAELWSSCFGILHPESADEIKSTADEGAKWVDEIVKELAKYEKKLTNLDSEYLPTLEASLADVLKNAATNSKAEQEINAQCDLMKFKASDSAAQTCKGDESVKSIKVAVNSHLKIKYPWFKWLVVAYTGDANDENPCTLEGTPSFDSADKHFVWAKSGDRRAIVTWSRPNPISDQSFEKAVSHLKKGLQVENVPKDQFDDKVDFVKDWVKNFYGYYDHSMSKKVIFCTFGGDKGKFHRSIVTSDIGIFRSYYSAEKIFDYVMSFYKVEE